MHTITLGPHEQHQQAGQYHSAASSNFMLASLIELTCTDIKVVCRSSRSDAKMVKSI
jgi:hypothetical protein